MQFMKITFVTLDDPTLVTAFLNSQHLLRREFTITLKSVAYKAYPLKDSSARMLVHMFNFNIKGNE